MTAQEKYRIAIEFLNDNQPEVYDAIVASLTEEEMQEFALEGA